MVNQLAAIILRIQRRFSRVTGIDNHHDSLRVARKNLEAAGVRADLIEVVYESRALDLLSLHAIGVFSGFGDDPPGFVV